jgi:uncharacterized protein (DUF1501 family)
MTSPSTGCRPARPHRRDFLHAGTLTLAGLGLADLMRGRAAAAPAGSFGRARSCILLFMTGGPSHIDTWDLKPDLPAEYRGEFRPIRTNVPGVQIGEHFPRLAGLADRYAVVRSLTHGDTSHNSGPHHLLTGRPSPRPGRNPGPGEWPGYGAVLARLGRGGQGLPPFIRLRPSVAGGPENLSPQCQGAGAGWLGQVYEPFSLDGDLLGADYRSENLVPRADLPPERLLGRRDLLRVVARRADHLGQGPAGAAGEALYEQAYRLLASPQARRAFDVSAEPDKVRERYGRNLHGHSVLMARRLVEAGVPLVTVFYQNDPVGGEDSTGWDTHGGNFPLLKYQLMPAADRALSALLEDLHERGLLGETLVVWVGEFGRAPKISKPGAGTTTNLGRDHWSRCFSGVLAGGGVKGGQVYGASDRTGAYPKDHPVPPCDLAATLYHCLGVDPQTMIPDAQGRPQAICEGKPIAGLLG